jgi:hypothetical protein
VDGRLFILEESELERQMTGLQWKLDDFGKLKEDKAQANHSTDCLIYARNAIAKLISAVPSSPPTPAQQAAASAKADPAEADRPERPERPEDDFADVLGDGGFDEWFGNGGNGNDDGL